MTTWIITLSDGTTVRQDGHPRVESSGALMFIKNAELRLAASPSGWTTCVPEQAAGTHAAQKR